MSKVKITYTNLLDHKGDFGQGIEIYNQPLVGEFPKAILSNVKTIGLTLNRTKLSSLPNQLHALKKLERLDLSNNEFDTFPEVICELESLRYLNFSKNKLTSLPHDIIYLRKLEEIVLDNNLFEEFPESLFDSTVEDVSFKKNKLKRVPPGINAMKNLSILVVSDNQLKALPTELSELPRLTELFASSNQIKCLPENFCTKARALKKLNLQGNPLVYPSAVSAGKGVTAIREYEKKHPRPEIPSDDDDDDETQMEEAESISREEALANQVENREEADRLNVEPTSLNGDVQEEEKAATDVTEMAEDKSNLEAEAALGQDAGKENDLTEAGKEDASPNDEMASAETDISERIPDADSSQPNVASEENESAEPPVVSAETPSDVTEGQAQSEAIPEHDGKNHPEQDEMQQALDETEERKEEEVQDGISQSPHATAPAAINAESVEEDANEQQDDVKEDQGKSVDVPFKEIIDNDTGEVSSAPYLSKESDVAEVPSPPASSDLTEDNLQDLPSAAEEGPVEAEKGAIDFDDDDAVREPSPNTKEAAPEAVQTPEQDGSEVVNDNGVEEPLPLEGESATVEKGRKADGEELDQPAVNERLI